MKTRKELAEAMRKKQLELLPITGPRLGITRKTIESMSDTEIIASYTRCSDCGDKIASIEEVDRVLEEDPSTLDEFWDLLQSLVRAKGIARRGIEHHKKKGI
jgi:hypothetical protein